MTKIKAKTRPRTVRYHSEVFLRDAALLYERIRGTGSVEELGGLVDVRSQRKVLEESEADLR